ncbi:MAG TPA: CBS domain-containing protein [Clostridia bacterium]|nr:CBS domain-containing protein [Clostridia bacterium]
MNIAFFLTPKKDVVFQLFNSTMRQAMERMEYHRYSAIPILSEDGQYVGTLTEGDLLWKLKNTPRLNFKNTSKILISDVQLHVSNKPVHINCDMEDLLTTAINQNFIPVVDDNNKFIGIIKRSVIINYCFEKLFAKVVKEA